MTAPETAGVRSGDERGAVSDALKLIARAVRAHQLYASNNPMHARALEQARDGLSSVWRLTDAVELGVTQTEFVFDEAPVFTDEERAGESLPWQLYKDGIRSFEISKGFEASELDRFLDALRAARSAGEGDDDLVTRFWECDFSYMTYAYVEAGGDGVDAPGASLLRPEPNAGKVDTSDIAAEGTVHGSSPSPFARIGDFDTTLYFLEDSEVAYLRDSIAAEFDGDLRPSVAAALFDTFEQENDPTVREEICGVLEGFLPALLAGHEFRTAAYLLRESTIVSSRAPSMVASHAERLRALVKGLSESAVLSQLLDSLEETKLAPPQSDLATLLGQLGAPSLPLLIDHLVHSRNAELRVLLESTVTRLASENTAELLALVASPDDAVAIEAIKRAGALRSPAAVDQLGAALASPSIEKRRAAVAALSSIGSAGAMRMLESSIDDPDRVVRNAAIQACVERGHRGIIPQLESVVKNAGKTEASAQEKALYFDAFAMLARDDAVPVLSGLLNPRSLFGKKEDSGTRAAAAMALGKIASETANEALRKATGDKDVVVRNAAARALRGGA